MVERLIALPEALYERIEQAAHQRQSSVDDVLAAAVQTLFLSADNTDTLESQLARLDDDQLWEVMHRPLPLSLESRLDAITERHEAGEPLTPDEGAEWHALTVQYQQWVLVRSSAIALLVERGHDVRARLRHAVVENIP